MIMDRKRHNSNDLASGFKSSKPGTVYALGENDVGQLGFETDLYGDSFTSLVQVPGLLPSSIVDIAAGGMHSSCLTVDGVVYTWGCDDEGALGRIEGAPYSPGVVSLPESIAQISAGDSHTAALTSSGLVYVWGVFRDRKGVIGLVVPGRIEELPVALEHSGVTVTKISSGADHLLMLGANGTVWAMGSNDVGQLGMKNTKYSLKLTKLVPFKCMNLWAGTYSTFVQKKTPEKPVLAMGLNNYSQLGFKSDCERPMLIPTSLEPVGKSSTIVQVSSADHHTVFLTDDGFVYTAGRKEYGRLGTRDKKDNQTATIVCSGLQQRVVRSISAGPSVSFAGTARGLAYSWGMGDTGASGHGVDVSVPTRIECLRNFKLLNVSAGGQHVLFLADGR